MRVRTKPCNRCGGSGRLEDQAVLGLQMRKLRQRAGISLREMARRLEISAPYLCDMELGKRNWLEPYRKAYHAL